jgi:large subunit ribosomal protein L29
MARSKAEAMRDLSDSELFERLSQGKEELFNLRFQNATGQLENHARLNHVKRDIARCLTELRTREIAAAEALAAQEENA